MSWCLIFDLISGLGIWYMIYEFDMTFNFRTRYYVLIYEPDMTFNFRVGHVIFDIWYDIWFNLRTWHDVIWYTSLICQPTAWYTFISPRPDSALLCRCAILVYRTKLLYCSLYHTVPHTTLAPYTLYYTWNQHCTCTVGFVTIRTLRLPSCILHYNPKIGFCSLPPAVYTCGLHFCTPHYNWRLQLTVYT